MESKHKISTETLEAFKKAWRKQIENAGIIILRPIYPIKKLKKTDGK